MFCPYCGKEIPDSDNFCPYCGKSVRKNNEVLNEAHPDGHDEFKPNKDSQSIIMIILCFIVPILGIILYFVWKKKTPQRAKGVLISAIIGFFIWYLMALQ